MWLAAFRTARGLRQVGRVGSTCVSLAPAHRTAPPAACCPLPICAGPGRLPRRAPNLPPPTAQHAGGWPGPRHARKDARRCCNRDLGGAASGRAVPSCGAGAAATAARRAGGVCTHQRGPGAAAAAWLREDALLPDSRCGRGQGSPASRCACSTRRCCTASSTVPRGGLLGPTPSALFSPRASRSSLSH